MYFNNDWALVIPMAMEVIMIAQFEFIGYNATGFENKR